VKRNILIAVSLIAVSGVVLADAFNRSVEVNDANNTLRAVLFAVDNDNKSGLELRDPNGRTRFSVHTNQNHDPFMNMIDANGKSRIEMGLAPNGDAYLLMRRGNGAIVHSFIAPN
jgi:hypothetical protein